MATQRALTWLTLVAMGVAACGGAEPESTKYTQTWTKDYDLTTCAEWLDEMDNHQRFVAAADMLLVLRRRDGDDSIPPDDMINSFAVEVSGICGAEAGDVAQSILDIGPLVYIGFPEQFKP